jgi:Mn2+/Fe2+ NRAMP family transporter
MTSGRWLAVLLWAVIAGAFIGPGTVVTAASAGAGYDLALIWAVAFSTVTCFLLQEAAARLTLATDRDLAGWLRIRASSGTPALALLGLVVGAVVIGCAAYEAGNILGAVAGASAVLPVSTRALTLVTGATAAALLWSGRPTTVARALGVLVAVMGLAFVVTAVGLAPSPDRLVRGALVPSLPPGTTLLVVALVGTTVVPYNLFLGSSLARGQNDRDTRFGLAVAIGLGGLVTAAIVVVGSAVAGEFTFAGLAAVLSERLGPWAAVMFAVGLCAAGLSSAVTAPLAAALTVRGAVGAERWSSDGWRFRSVWAGVLLVGVVFGLLDVRPVPAIVLAQALNGVMLPVVAVVLLVAVNDRSTLGSRLPSLGHTVLLGGAVAVTVMLGTSSVVRAVTTALRLDPPSPGRVLVLAAAVAAAAAVPTANAVRRGRQSRSGGRPRPVTR